jgi:hypothetical protein
MVRCFVKRTFERFHLFTEAQNQLHSDSDAASKQKAKLIRGDLESITKHVNASRGASQVLTQQGKISSSDQKVTKTWSHMLQSEGTRRDTASSHESQGARLNHPVSPAPAAEGLANEMHARVFIDQQKIFSSFTASIPLSTRVINNKFTT